MWRSAHEARSSNAPTSAHRQTSAGPPRDYSHLDLAWTSASSSMSALPPHSNSPSQLCSALALIFCNLAVKTLRSATLAPQELMLKSHSFSTQNLSPHATLHSLLVQTRTYALDLAQTHHSPLVYDSFPTSIAKTKYTYVTIYH